MNKVSVHKDFYAKPWTNSTCEFTALMAVFKQSTDFLVLPGCCGGKISNEQSLGVCVCLEMWLHLCIDSLLETEM